MSEEEKAIKFLQFCAENFEINERIENKDNPFLFAKAIIEKQQKEIGKQKDLYEKLFNAYNERVKEIEELEADIENEKKCVEDMGE